MLTEPEPPEEESSPASKLPSEPEFLQDTNRNLKTYEYCTTSELSESTVPTLADVE